MRSLTALLVASLLPAAAPQGLTPAQREVFELLDAFDPPDPGTQPLVEVTIRRFRHTVVRYGFLQACDGRTAHVRYVDLGRAELTLGGGAAGEEVTIAPVDAQQVLDRACAHLTRAPGERANSQSGVDVDAPTPTAVQALLLARACARLGHLAAVQRAWETLPAEFCTREELTGHGRSGAILSATLADRLVFDFTDPQRSWQDLLARHERWLALFPRSPSQANVIARRNGIATMLQQAQERRHGGANPTPEDLVWALRNEFALPGHAADTSPVLPQAPPPPGAVSPHARLLAEGLPVAQALIDALADDSLTRCVVLHRLTGVRVQTVGDLAAITLEDLAGYRPEGQERSAAWRNWLEQAQRRGIDELLVDRARTLDPWAIESYVRRHPDRIGQVTAWLDQALHTAGPGLRVLLHETHAALPASLEHTCRRFVTSAAPDRERGLVAHDLLRFGILVDKNATDR